MALKNLLEPTVAIFILTIACVTQSPVSNTATSMPLELAISRRMSIRNFLETQVPWELVSNVLWAGYGYSSKGRTIPSLCGNYPLVVYVCNETAAYKYNPETQSLELWKNGGFRNYGAHPAPIQLYIALDTNKSDDIYWGSAEAGSMGQNIYLKANALNLGTVCVGSIDRNAIHDGLSLPENESVLYNMPLGYPQPPYYNFTSLEPPASTELPEIKESSTFLEDALNERTSSHDWSETTLTSQETSQVLWAAYGLSYLNDTVQNKQHRTVPSAYGSYPMTIYAANQSGIFKYLPYNHTISAVVEGDHRAEIALATGQNWVATAPFMLISVWDSDKLDRKDFAYYEIGCIIQNIHLESTAWGLVADWVKDVDENATRTILGLNEQTHLHPTSIITIGHPYVPPHTYLHEVIWNENAYYISVLTNSTLSNFAFNQPEKQESFSVAGPTGTKGFCNVTIPVELLDGTFTVSINENPLDYTIRNNDTHTFLYFVYNHSNLCRVNITGTTVIPEFSTTVFVVLLILATLAAVILANVIRARPSRIRNTGTRREKHRRPVSHRQSDDVVNLRVRMCHRQTCKIMHYCDDE